MHRRKERNIRKHSVRYQWVTLANIDWTMPRKAPCLSRQHASQGSTSRKTMPRKAQCLARLHVSQNHASQGPCLARLHASQGPSKHRQTPPKPKQTLLLQASQDHPKPPKPTLLLNASRDSLHYRPRRRKDSTVPPSLFSIAHPRIPSPLRALRLACKQTFRCTVVPVYSTSLRKSRALALPTCPLAGEPPFAATVKVYRKPFSRIPKALTMTCR
jgi:hypothetical protein